MREKSVTAVIVVLLLSLSVSLISITAGAEADVGVYLSTDKPYYTYGQSGKLYVAIRNEETGPIEIKNISVTFPWFGWYNGKWDGNETIKDIDDAIAGNATSDTYVVSFSVPAEGRDVMAYTNVQVGYLWGDELHYEPGSIYISIETPVTQNPNLTPILYLMGIDTVLLILVIIGLAYVWMRKQTPLPSATG